MRYVVLCSLFIFVFTACDSDSSPSTCGNGVVDPGEECDGENFNGSYCEKLGFYGGLLGCSRKCQLDISDCVSHGSCGDGVIQEKFESCDGTPLDTIGCAQLGYGEGDLYCTWSCRYDLTMCSSGERCGDGVVDPNEECDGDDLSGATCALIGEYIGGELRCGSDCLFDRRLCYSELVCGDGIVRGDEECDLSNHMGHTCLSLGYEGGVLACTEACTLDPSGCSGEVFCGDGVKNGTEECDGDDVGGRSCANFGWHDGEILCRDDCTMDMSACEATGRCGDGIIQSEYEFCDGDEVSGETCQSQGYYEGTLSCLLCMDLDYSSCSGFCGDGILDPTYGEECDLNTFSDMDDIDNICWLSELTCDQECKAGIAECTNYLELTLPGEERFTAISGDQYGFLYLAGTTTDTVDGTENRGGIDAFLLKRNRLGGEVWSTQFGGAGDDIITSAQASGDTVVVAGVTFSALQGVPQGDGDLFVASLADDGSINWIVQQGSPARDEVTAVAVDGAGEIYVAGITWGLLGAGASGGADLFVAKFASTGTLLWLTQWGSPADDGADAIAIDPAGNLYVTGYTEGSISGGNQGGRDAVVTRLSPAGVIEWSTQFGTSAGDRGRAIVFHESGRLFVAGETAGAIAAVPHAGGVDIFLASLDLAGTVLWSVQDGNSEDQWVAGMTMDASALHIAGTTAGLLGESEAGGTDMFCATFTHDGTLLATVQSGTPHDETAYGLHMNVDGHNFAAGSTAGVFADGSAATTLEAVMVHFPLQR